MLLNTYWQIKADSHTNKPSPSGAFMSQLVLSCLPMCSNIAVHGSTESVEDVRELYIRTEGEGGRHSCEAGM